MTETSLGTSQLKNIQINLSVDKLTSINLCVYKWVNKMQEQCGTKAGAEISRSLIFQWKYW